MRTADGCLGLEEWRAPTQEPTQDRGATHRVIERSDCRKGADAGQIGGEHGGRRNPHSAEACSRQPTPDLARGQRAVMLIPLARSPTHVAIGPASRNEAD